MPNTGMDTPTNSSYVLPMVGILVGLFLFVIVIITIVVLILVCRNCRKHDVDNAGLEEVLRVRSLS